MAGGAPWGQAETHGTGNARTAGSSAIDMRREGRGAFLVLRLWCSLVRCAGERAFGPKEQNPREKLFSRIFGKKHEIEKKTKDFYFWKCFVFLVFPGEIQKKQLNGHFQENCIFFKFYVFFKRHVR